MNKLFTKIAALSAGLAMAIGVGVALGQKGAVEAKAGGATIDLTAQSFTNQQVVETVTSGDFTLTFAKAGGSNDPKYYTSGSSVRTYASNTLTVSTSGSDNITKIEFTLGGTTTATPTTDVGTYDGSTKTWTGSSKTIVFTNAASGQYHYKTVTITSGSLSGPFTVTYEANGGSGTMTDTTEYDSGDLVTVSSCTFTPADSFHEFDSFNTKADGSGTSYDEGDKFNISEDVTLYAIWAIKDVTLGNGNYTATFPFVAAGYPNEINLLDSSDNPVGLIEVDAEGLARYSTYNEYELSVSGHLTFKNHSNALITKVVVNVYKFDNFKLSVGSSVLHTGNGASGTGDPVVFEIDVATPSTDDIKIEHYTGSGSYTQKFYSVVLYFKIGSDVVHTTGVSLNAESGNVYVGKTRQLTADVAPANADDRSVAWTSSNSSVATVDSTGLVTGVAAGNATITVTTTDGGFTATFAATVKTYSAGTLANPLTPEEAREVFEINGSSNTDEEVYVRGIVSQYSYDADKSWYVAWLQNTDGSVAKYLELYRVSIDDGVAADYYKEGALKYASVTAHGFGVIYSGTTYELVQDSKIVDIDHNANSFAYYFSLKTNATCSGYDGESDNTAALTAYWADLEEIYDLVEDKTVLANADADESGNDVEKAMARYDYVTGKYGLTNFITGRTPVAFAPSHNTFVAEENNMSIIVVLSIAIASIAGASVLLILKKRKETK